MYKGSCLCGSVEITVTGEISDIIHCHCSLCRKASGSAYATNGFVNVLGFEINNGQELVSSFESRPGKFRYFCSKCASPIYSSNEQDKTRIRIRLGILDSDILEKPMSHNFVTSKANWEDLDAVLPRYEQHEPNRV